MKIPERACRLKLDLQADTRDEMVRALEGIATSIDRSEMSTGCSGGVHSGWTYEYIQNTGPTHEQYQAQLKAYIAAKRAEKETRGDALPIPDFLRNQENLRAERAAAAETVAPKSDGVAICCDCPPLDYPTDKTRCAECPRLNR